MTDSESLRRKIADEEARLARIDKERAEVLARLKDLKNRPVGESDASVPEPIPSDGLPFPSKIPSTARRRSLSSVVYSEGGRMSSRNCGRTQRPDGKDTLQPAPMSGFEGSVRSPASSAGSVLNGPSFLSPIKSSLVTCRAAMSSGS